MAVQPITGKKIIKYDIKNPNFDPESLKKPEKKVSGNVQEDTDIYGERKHTYVPDSNGNLKMEELMGKMLNKLDNIPEGSQTGTKAIEVDIKREIAIGKVDTSAVKSEEFVGKVKTKKDKLKALRKRNGN
tara:strand:+ start:648 stop:1037 length:390 start_codon:yes stop_codon:yes gene_type:complete